VTAAPAVCVDVCVREISGKRDRDRDRDRETGKETKTEQKKCSPLGRCIRRVRGPGHRSRRPRAVTPPPAVLVDVCVRQIWGKRERERERERRCLCVPHPWYDVSVGSEGLGVEAEGQGRRHHHRTVRHREHRLEPDPCPSPTTTPARVRQRDAWEEIKEFGGLSSEQMKGTGDRSDTANTDLNAIPAQSFASDRCDSRGRARRWGVTVSVQGKREAGVLRVRSPFLPMGASSPSGLGSSALYDSPTWHSEYTATMHARM
jgi:hypothetical protein